MHSVQFWLTSAMSAVAIILAIFNSVVATSNLALQAEAQRRAHLVLQSNRLEQKFEEILRSLGELSERNGDEQLKALLENVAITPVAGGSAAAAPKQ